MRSSRRMNLAAAMAVAAIAGMGAAQAAMPAPRKGSSRDYNPEPRKLDTDLQRAIAEHNAEVDRRKEDRRLRRLANKNPGY